MTYGEQKLPSTVFTSETGRAASVKAAASRTQRARAVRSPLWPIERDLKELVTELVKAAKGEEPYELLRPEERLKALVKCLEYGLGRPEAVSKTQTTPKPPAPGLVVADDEDPPEEREGLAFG